VTGMVDLTRDTHGQLHARLLDVVPGRTGTAYAGWLKQQPDTFTTGIKQVERGSVRRFAAPDPPKRWGRGLARSICTRSPTLGNGPPWSLVRRLGLEHRPRLLEVWNELRPWRERPLWLTVAFTLLSRELIFDA